MAEVVSARLGAGLLERLDAARGETSRGAWLLALVTAELSGSRAVAVSRAPVAAGLPAGAIGTLGPGTPSPGILCHGPGCSQRDTARYGLAGLPLCPGCAHAAAGLPYTGKLRDLPPAWRARRGDQRPAEPAPVPP